MLHARNARTVLMQLQQQLLWHEATALVAAMLQLLFYLLQPGDEPLVGHALQQLVVGVGDGGLGWGLVIRVQERQLQRWGEDLWGAGKLGMTLGK